MSYIDKKVALQYLANSEKLFTKLKTNFINTYKNSAEKITELVHNNDINELYEYVHSIKGVSLNIGSSILFDDSNALLEKLKKGEMNSSLIEQYIHTLRMCISELEQL